MAQHDMNIANQSFPDFRTDLNNSLSAINSMHSGTSRPSGAVAGTMWLDTTSASSPTIKFFDGSDDISFATIDYSANTVNFLDSTVVADILGDTTPQLGGQLDVNGNSIGDGTRELLKFIETASAVNEVSVTNSATGNAPESSATGDDTNIDLKLTPKGSGKLNLDGIKFPNADGSANQILTTNGSGVLSFADASGGGTSWQSAVKTANFTAVAGEGYFVNTTGGAFEIDLPTSPSVGDEIEFVDFARKFETNALTLDQGSNKFQGFTTPKPVYNTTGQNIRIVYSGSTQGWIPVRDDDVTNETPQSYSVDYLVVAGGGGGGYNRGGGGGAGGYRASYNSEASGGGGSSETALAMVGSTVYTVTVGSGGTPSSGGSDAGVNGGDSTISGSDITDVTSTGGGGGGSSSSTNGSVGGSGGGGCGNPVTNGASGTANQGFAGATGSGSPPNHGGGGGGAGEAGNTDGTSHGGDGVASTITASPTTRAGGGGGNFEFGSPPNGGAGGGGFGGGEGFVATAATANTGGGGGGGSGGGGAPDNNGRAGGSGVVILRMATSDYSGTTSGSPTVTTSGSDTIITFNASGSYTG